MTAGPLASAGPAPPAADGRERLAALDVGSNSIRLLVAEYDRQTGLSIIDEVKDQPRLAQGLAATGRLDDAAIERAMATLARMREVCRRRGVRRIAAVATAAVREAANGAAFVRRVREELDLPLRVIDAETEARLSYRSVAHHFRVVGADARGGHRRGEPRAHRRGGRPGRVVIGQTKALAAAVRNNRTVRRFSGLLARLKSGA